MATNKPMSNEFDWVEASGIRHLLRILRMAIHPSKLCIALVAITLTLLFGRALDAVWTPEGGIDRAAISRFIEAKKFDAPYEHRSGDRRIFQTWKTHELNCIVGLLGSSLPGTALTTGTPVGAFIERNSQAQPLQNIAGMVYGMWWLVRYHFLFSLFLGTGVLLIWSLAGGAICRAAATEFACHEKLSIKRSLGYARRKLIGGFFLAPCIPLIFMLLTFILLVAGGLLLRIPWLGDLLAGLAFGLAIFGGFIIMLMVLGLLIGGSLFWPAIAVEGSDAFDAFSRGISYPVSKPWKAMLYAGLSLMYAGACWVFVNLFTFYTLKITHVCVRMGAGWFGWWQRGVEGEPANKLDAIWPMSGIKAVYDWPTWSQLHGGEWLSAALIAFYVLLVIGLMWSFLVTFYFSGSTVIYFLLRRDVDGTDLEDLDPGEDVSASHSDGQAPPPAAVEKPEPASDDPEMAPD